MAVGLPAAPAHHRHADHRVVLPAPVHLRESPAGDGCGAIGNSGGSNYFYEPPDPDFTDERSLIIEAADGDYNYRWLFRRVMLSDSVNFNLMRTEAITFPLKFDVLESGTPSQKPWAFQTDDPEIGQFALVGT